MKMLTIVASPTRILIVNADIVRIDLELDLCKSQKWAISLAIMIVTAKRPEPRKGLDD
jgi:hypothetical protein